MTGTVPVLELDPDRDGLFRAWADVLTQAARHDLGGDHSSRTPEERRAILHDPARRTTAFLTRDAAERVVGAGWVSMPLHDNPRLALLDLAVLPEVRGRGHGRALLEHAEDVVREAGRDLAVVETQWAAGGEDRNGGFARRFGYAAAQTDLRSSLALPVDRERLAGLLATDDGYRLETSVGGIPDAWLEARAELGRRMSTDAPMGHLELEEEHWDAERVRGEYAQIVESGRTAVDTFAFAADGTVVGYTQVTVTTYALAYQRDTLVVHEHRGHGLGLRLKAANTLAVMDRFPDVTTVRTWNAEENAPMLAVNRALGYEPDAYLCEWQKVLR